MPHAHGRSRLLPAIENDGSLYTLKTKTVHRKQEKKHVFCRLMPLFRSNIYSVYLRRTFVRFSLSFVFLILLQTMPDDDGDLIIIE